MGRSTKHTTGGKAAEAPAKRKRRRKARRTDVSSSSESSSSDSDSSSEGEEEVMKGKLKGQSAEGEEMDVEMRDADAVSSSDEEAEEQIAAATAGSLAQKSGHIPPQLRSLNDPIAASRFEEYYLNLVTQEFGDNLYSIRDAKDFDPAKSMPMLVRALKQGVNIFDPDEKRMLISGLSKGEEK